MNSAMSGPARKVFLSYAREDTTAARRLYSDLISEGVDVWFDQEDLLPGTRWTNAIADAIKNASFFIAVLSKNSVTKRGYVQKELKLALEVLREFPDSDIFLIPVRLDNCHPATDEVASLQWVDLFDNWQVGISRLLTVLKPQSRGFTPLPSTASSLQAKKARVLFGRTVECPNCQGIGAPMSHSRNDEQTQWFMCYDCHIPFPMSWEWLMNL